MSTSNKRGLKGPATAVTLGDALCELPKWMSPLASSPTICESSIAYPFHTAASPRLRTTAHQSGENFLEGQQVLS